MFEPIIGKSMTLAQIPAKIMQELKLYSFSGFESHSLSELLQNSGFQMDFEFEGFWAIHCDTMWGHVRIANGRAKFTLLLELNVISATPVQQNGLCAEGYVVKYCLSTLVNVTEIYITNSVLMKKGLPEFFSLPPPGSKKNAELCDRLIRHIILKKSREGDNSNYIEIGERQGWNVKSNGKVVFETVDNYPEVVHPILPKSILHRNKAMLPSTSRVFLASIRGNLHAMVSENKKIKL